MSDSKNIRKEANELRAGNVRFGRAVTICTRWFGSPRIRGSHHIFKMPWKGRPTINLQEVKGGKAKGYQIDQAVEALEKLAVMKEDDDE